MTSGIRRRSFLLSGAIAALPALAAFPELKAREKKLRPGYRVLPAAEAERQQARVVRKLDPETSSSSVVFSPKGDLLASGGSKLTIWEPRSGKALRVIDTPVSRLVFSSDGTKLAGIAGRDVVTLWNPTDGKVARTLKIDEGDPSIHFAALAFSPDGKTLAVGGSEGPRLIHQGDAIWLFDPSSAEFRGKLKRGTTQVAAIAFSPDGKRLASGGGAGISSDEIVLWDPFAESALKEWLPDRVGEVKAELRFNPAPGDGVHVTDAMVQSIAFSVDGTLLAAAGSTMVDPQYLSGNPQRELIRIFDAKTYKPLRTLTKPNGETLAGDSALGVSFSPDGRILASGCYDHTVKLWNPRTGELLQTIPTAGWVASVSFSADGKMLAAADTRGGVVLIAF